MVRFFAGAAAAFLLLTGAFLIWQGRAEQSAALPPAPQSSGHQDLLRKPEAARAPEATPKSREERRFARADKDDNARIEREEMLGSRRKAFAKLDKNGNKTLSFDEWAVKTIDKFQGADKDRSGWLSAAEYATTAPPPPKPKKCAC